MIEKEHICSNCDCAASQMEVEANQFAMALLLPLPLLKTAYASTVHLGTSKQLSTLASKFKVSRALVAARLYSLGFIL